MSATATENTTGTNISIRELMEVGAHFGHPTAKWNPKMKRYIHTSRNGVYIINLQKTLGHFRDSIEIVRGIAASGQKVLFVGTKRQAKDVIREEAERAGMPYVNERWIGGCLTNFHTIKRSIALMKQLQKMDEEDSYGTRKKKEILLLKKKQKKLEMYYTGVKDMVELPGAMFVIDPNREFIGVAEGNVLNIPIIATLDTNCDPDSVQYPIPGNDDSMRAIKLYASKIADAILAGKSQRASNLTSGTAETAPISVPQELRAGEPVVEKTASTVSLDEAKKTEPQAEVEKTDSEK